MEAKKQIKIVNIELFLTIIATINIIIIKIKIEANEVKTIQGSISIITYMSNFISLLKVYSFILKVLVS